MTKSVLVVDDEASVRESLQRVLQRADYETFVASDAEEALQRVSEKTIDIVITDLKMPETDGISLLRAIKDKTPETEVIVLTGYGSIETAVEAMKEGAYDFITKPVKKAVILKAVERAVEKQELAQENRFLREQLEKTEPYGEIIGESHAIREVMAMVERVAPLPSTVLITGESGTGKELIARALHQLSDRRNKRFVAVNCGAIPENLMESELFGHVRGAFTGAVRDKEGLFKTASGGTLFLDEISTVPMNVQVKLLRAIEHKEIKPVGSNTTHKIDVRIVAATNRNLGNEVEAGLFREDLYYRLNVVGITIPPLRERREDIPILVDHFIKVYNVMLKKRVRGVDERTMGLFMNYQWKGNVRELENMIERAMILCDGDIIHPEHLPQNLSGRTTNDLNGSLRDVVRQAERDAILRTLRLTNNDKKRAADMLGLSQSSLYRKMAELGIPTGEGKNGE